MHAYLLVCFAFVAIFVGVVTEFLLEKHLPQLPYSTPCRGRWPVRSAADVSAGEGDERHVWSRSLHMWLHIDPHVLLFAFLPLLLRRRDEPRPCGTSSRSSCSACCSRCPACSSARSPMGLLAYGVLPARYEWDMNMCMTFGAILAATDPVAVVALLKSLGASHASTMIIEGESLLNDGTAMVLFNLFYDRLSGSPDAASTPREILATFAQMALGGPALGFVFELVALVMLYVLSERDGRDLRRATRARRGSSRSRSRARTRSFFVGEHVCAVSGVLCTVTAARARRGGPAAHQQPQGDGTRVAHARVRRQHDHLPARGRARRRGARRAHPARARLRLAARHLGARGRRARADARRVLARAAPVRGHEQVPEAQGARRRRHVLGRPARRGRARARDRRQAPRLARRGGRRVEGEVEARLLFPSAASRSSRCS